MKFLYNFLLFLFFFLKGFTNKKKFIIFSPKFLGIITKKIIIYNKTKKIFLTQFVRDTNDIDTVYEIFGNEDYDILKYIKIENYNYKLQNKTPLVIDCGSNIGSSSLYLKELINNSKIISIEPDLRNFNQIKKNFTSENKTLINSAVASEKKKFKVITSENNRAHKVDFNEKYKENANMTVTINEILNEFEENKYHPFLIKIDIEGSELDLFSKNIEWLDKFEILIIELHDWMLPNNSNSLNFFNSLSYSSKNGNKRDVIISGENLICIKI